MRRSVVFFFLLSLDIAQAQKKAQSEPDKLAVQEPNLLNRPSSLPEVRSLQLINPEKGNQPFALSRFWLRVRPIVGVLPLGGDVTTTSNIIALVTDFGVEINTRYGFQIGFEIAPLAVASNVIVPSVSSRLYVGYANEYLGIGMAFGSSLSLYYPQSGPVLRIGKFSGVHARLRLTWSISPPRIVPVDGSLEMNVPVAKRIRLHLDVGGAYGNLLGVYGLAGCQLFLSGRGENGTTLLSFAAGVAWTQYSLGPAGSIGVEQRW